MSERNQERGEGRSRWRVPDVERSEVTKLVYRRLADPKFRTRLVATGPDGCQPIVIALRADPVSALLKNLAAVGGIGNVVVPLLNGFFVVAVRMGEPSASQRKKHDPPLLDKECTVGVLMERLRFDFGGDRHEVAARIVED